MSTTQKIIKYVAVAFAISLILGIISGIYYIGKEIGGFLTESNKEKSIEISEYPNTSNILSIDIAASKLIIKEGASLKVENNNEYITTEQDNNKLSIKEKKHHSFFASKDSELTIYIPKDLTFDEVFISNGAGIINIEKLISKNLKLELGAGEVTINNLEVLKDTSIDSGAGAVTISKSNLNNLDLNVGVGKFIINSILTGNSKIDAGIGELNINLLDSKENYLITADKGIGSIKIDGVEYKNETSYGNGENKIDIDGGIGSINISFAE